MRILMLEDNKALSKLMHTFLSKEFRVDAVYNMDEASAYIQRYDYDIALLDRNIDGIDLGLELVEKIKIKNPSAGVIIISAYGAVSDKIEGLNVGADDYLEKPFDFDELYARIYALSRRHTNTNNIEYEGLSCDIQNSSISYEGKNIDLSKKESDLFFYLIKNKNKLFSSDELLDALYLHPEDIASSTIRVTIAHIRKKLPIEIIKTVKTRGYIIEV
ncbi:response regulator transcription factor [Sulfurimonas sp. MAG313]|nr:response regulator transcription factor [Sulfurimonas sp. MAG313]MDF1880769.1 response regulator transcription factor [Sulfurimonas sp. MAG313]